MVHSPLLALLSTAESRGAFPFTKGRVNHCLRGLVEGGQGKGRLLVLFVAAEKQCGCTVEHKGRGLLLPATDLVCAGVGEDGRPARDDGTLLERLKGKTSEVKPKHRTTKNEEMSSKKKGNKETNSRKGTQRKITAGTLKHLIPYADTHIGKQRKKGVRERQTRRRRQVQANKQYTNTAATHAASGYSDNNRGPTGQLKRLSQRSRTWTRQTHHLTSGRRLFSPLTFAIHTICGFAPN